MISIEWHWPQPQPLKTGCSTATTTVMIAKYSCTSADACSKTLNGMESLLHGWNSNRHFPVAQVKLSLVCHDRFWTVSVRHHHDHHRVHHLTTLRTLLIRSSSSKSVGKYVYVLINPLVPPVQCAPGQSSLSSRR